MATAAETRRLGAGDWAEAALDAIAEGGIGNVAIEPLARRLGVTKGSFYWHFANRDALLTAALERWEQEMEQLASMAQQAAGPRERLENVFRLSSQKHRAHATYSALATHADHPLIQPVLERIATRRLGELTRAYQDLGLDQATARQRAQLTYASYLGFMNLLQQLPHTALTADDYEQYARHVAATLLP